jgi:hypothetical protein
MRLRRKLIGKGFRAIALGEDDGCDDGNEVRMGRRSVPRKFKLDAVRLVRERGLPDFSISFEARANAACKYDVKALPAARTVNTALNVPPSPPAGRTQGRRMAGLVLKQQRARCGPALEGNSNRSSS